MNKRTMKKGLAIVLALVMVFAMTATAFAETTPSGNVTVSVMQNNFDLSGNYVGNGSNVPIGTDEEGNSRYIANFIVPISTVESNIANGYKYLYLPAETTDPMNGAASVLDAIIAALDLNGVTDFDTGCDPTNLPEHGLTPGGYIHNINSDGRVSNTVTYFEGTNGNKWGRSVGSGWNVAYGTGSALSKANVYTSNIPLTAGMHIVIDISAFDMTWDTYTPWTE